MDKKEKRKLYMREYIKSSKVKDKIKEYNKRPEVRARKKQYSKKYKRENKQKIKDYYRLNKKEICLICGKPANLKYCSPSCQRIGQTGKGKIDWKDRKQINQYIGEHRKKDIIKQKIKRYNQTEDVKRRKREYHRRPEIKDKMRKKYRDNKKNKCIICGKPAKIKYCSIDCKHIGISGENNCNWNGGPKVYSKNWNNRFKRTIRERDGNMCMICNRHRDEFKRALSVHHIDGNPKNTIESNCISLCQRHHAIVEHTGNKKYTFWMPRFRKMLNKLYGYKYD